MNELEVALEKPPQIIWLQWYDESRMFFCEDEPELNTGLILAHPEDRTWCDEPICVHDVGPYIHSDQITKMHTAVVVQKKHIAELEAENERFKRDAFTAYGDLACMPEWGMDEYLERAKSAHDTLAKLFEDYPAWEETQ